MNKVHTHRVFLFKVSREMFGAIDRTVLSARTTESHLEMTEIAFNEPLYVMIYKCIHRLKESQYLAVLLEEVDDRLVQARHGLELLVFAGVVRTTAVEDISTAVAGFVCRYTTFKREGVDRY